MNLPERIWKQVRNKTADELIAALQRDGFQLDMKIRTERVYRHADRRKVSIHYHKGSQTYSAGLLKALLQDTRWSEEDMKRLKLVK